MGAQLSKVSFKYQDVMKQGRIHRLAVDATSRNPVGMNLSSGKYGELRMGHATRKVDLALCTSTERTPGAVEWWILGNDALHSNLGSGSPPQQGTGTFSGLLTSSSGLRSGKLRLSGKSLTVAVFEAAHLQQTHKESLEITYKRTWRDLRMLCDLLAAILSPTSLAPA